MFRKIVSHLRNNPQYIVYLYFFLLAWYISYVISTAIIPDETVHYSAIEYYTRHTPNPFPNEQYDLFNAGELTRLGSYLYYYLMGFVYRLGNIFNLDHLYLIRFFSVIFSTLSLVYLNKIADLLKVEKKIKTATLFAIANIPMFLVISAGVNYDALAILISISMAYQLIKLSKNFNITTSLIIFNLIILGPLVKFAIAPISLSAGIAYVIILFTRNKKAPRKKKQSKKSLRVKKIAIIVLALTTLFTSLLAFQRFGLNYLEYGSINPSCEKIIAVEKCNENFVYNRNRNYKELDLPDPKVNYLNYASSWVQIMSSRTFGVLAHRKFSTNYMIVYTCMYFGMLIILMFIRRYKLTRATLFIFISTIVYIVALVLANLSALKMSHDIGLAVQGRYIFPVAFTFIILTLSLYAKDFNKIKDSLAYKSLVWFIVTFAILAGPVYLYYGVDKHWVKNDLFNIKDNLVTDSVKPNDKAIQY